MSRSSQPPSPNPRPTIGRYISPFRYPGGKTWFLKIARKWLAAQAAKPEILVEPFAGGAVISLTAVGHDLVDSAVFAELDEEVAATWETILNGHALWLTQQILSFQVSRSRVEQALHRPATSTHERAFQCLLRNRMARGGLLAKGAGLLRRGEDGRGLRSRWYPKGLIQRIKTIAALKPDIEFRGGDGFALIREHLNDPGAVLFIDPPYTKAARRLYSHWLIDHAQLFRLLARAKGDVLMTYDDTSEIRTLADKHGFQVRKISMRTTHHHKKRELMISREFDWLK